MKENDELSTEPGTAEKVGRRDFLKRTSAAAMVLAMPVVPEVFKNVPMGIVVHSYATRWNQSLESKTYPAFSNAIQLLEHCQLLNAGGIQVGVKDWSIDFARKVREKREKLGLYLEGSISVPGSEADVVKFEKDVAAAKEAGARVLRTVCSPGRRYEVFHSLQAFQDAQKNAIASLQWAEPVLRKYKMKLGVENHKDWRANELAAIMKQMNSEWIGVTLDFGNSIALLEDPLEVVETLAPYMFTTHVKDMGLAEYGDGFLLSEVPLGTGMLDLTKIVSICRKNNPTTTYNLEMITRDPLQIPCLKEEYWSTFEGVKGVELARTLRDVRQHPFKPDLPRVSQLSTEERLAIENQNIVDCLTYSKKNLGI